MQKLIFTAFIAAAAEGDGALWKFYAFPSFQFGKFSRTECKKWKCFNHHFMSNHASYKMSMWYLWQEIMGSLFSKGSGNVMPCHGLALLSQLLCQSVRGVRGHLGHASLSKSMLRFSETGKAKGKLQNAQKISHSWILLAALVCVREFIDQETMIWQKMLRGVLLWWRGSYLWWMGPPLDIKWNRSAGAIAHFIFVTVWRRKTE